MTFIIIVGLYFLLRAAAKNAQKQRALEQARRKQELVYYERQRIAEQREAWRRQQAIAKAETQRQIAQERERIRREQAAAKAREQAAKDAERRRKADFERQQAQTDLDNLDAIREGYMRLYDALEAEAQRKDTTEKRRLAIQRQLLTLDEKLYKLDARRAKAYFVAVEGRAC